MQSTWTTSSASAANIFLANNLTRLCASTLGWDKPLVQPSPPALKSGAGAGTTSGTMAKQAATQVAVAQTAAIANPWDLSVTFPTRLVSGTKRQNLGIEDGLDAFYLELPRVTVA
jgi:hypothetical protein